jgi:hypothetical protein
VIEASVAVRLSRPFVATTIVKVTLLGGIFVAVVALRLRGRLGLGLGGLGAHDPPLSRGFHSASDST